MTETMKAVRFHDYGPADVLREETVPRPDPGPGEVLVRVHAAGVNPFDWKVRSGHMREFLPLTFPTTPGLDVAGTIEVVGQGVTGFSRGEAVFGRGTGTYAEYALVPVSALARKPARLSFDEAATLSVAGVTAWVGLFDLAKVEAGQRVLVHGGAGGVGLFAVQLAHWHHAHVIATASTRNVEFVQSLGADEVVDYTTAQFEAAVRDVDVVFDTVGGDVMQRSLGVIKRGGWLVEIVGMPPADLGKDRDVHVAAVQAPAELRTILERIGTLVEEGHLQPHVGHVYRLSDAALAQRESETGHGRGRIVLHVAD